MEGRFIIEISLKISGCVDIFIFNMIFFCSDHNYFTCFTQYTRYNDTLPKELPPIVCHKIIFHDLNSTNMADIPKNPFDSCLDMNF